MAPQYGILYGSITFFKPSAIFFMRRQGEFSTGWQEYCFKSDGIIDFIHNRSRSKLTGFDQPRDLKLLTN